MFKIVFMPLILLAFAYIKCVGFENIFTGWILGLMAWGLLCYYSNKDYGNKKMIEFIESKTGMLVVTGLGSLLILLLLAI